FALRTYTNAPTLTFAPPFNSPTTPEGFIERPAANETVRGVYRVSGITYDTGSANMAFVTRRDIFIDDVQRTFTTTTVSRPDYCATNPVTGCPVVGFQSDINLPALGLA